MPKTIVSQSGGNTKPFETSIQVAGATIAPDDVNEGGVVLSFGTDGERVLTLAEACALGAALQAVAVYQMETQPREIRRSTKPGAPAFEEMN